MTIEIAHLKAWEGRTETRSDRLNAFPANALAATLDRDERFSDGDALPPLWHWLYFLQVFALADAGYDGHKALGGFLPPVPLPRRMWAGGRLRFLAPLRIGAALEKRSTVLSVAHKAGRSGDLVFVTVQHQVFDGGTLAVEEEHDIVYRGAPQPDAPLPPLVLAPQESGFMRGLTPDPVLLFRYFALTFNGHRIHYDRSFCTETEGYDGLVVHGPLLATLMLDLVRRDRPAAEVTGFSFRALAPVTDMAPFAVHGTEVEDGLRLWVTRSDGALAMEGQATLAA